MASVTPLRKLTQDASAFVSMRPDTAGQLSPAFELEQDSELFRTPEGRAYATIRVGDHEETWALKSRGFRQWLSRRFYLSEGRIPTEQKMREALAALSGKALFEGDERRVHLRLARHGGDIYLDLADESWRVVRVSRDGWRAMPGGEAPVRFERKPGMLALPEPQPGGAADELRRFVNVGGDHDWALLASWVVAALNPDLPYPVLALCGEQGSAKSTTARMLCALIDPNEAALRCQQRGERDFMIAATNRWLYTLDNVSHIPARLSDSLCRLATGGGFATRELRTDTDEVIFNARRPVILNGIEEVATRSDLLDRSLMLYLPSLPAEKRRTEREVMEEFEHARPRILGALLGAVSAALRRVDGVKLESPPRMADFARWATAAEPGLGLADGAFLAAYAGNRAEANELALDSSPVGKAVLAFMEGRGEHVTTAGELLRELNAVVSESTRRQKDWAKSARGLSGALRRVTANLLAAGVRVRLNEREPGTGRRLIRLEQA